MSGVCVCVCTHDRPDGLGNLLRALVPQLTSSKAALVIVDNGKLASEAVIAPLADGINYTYTRLIEPGLVAARNNALMAALKTSPEFIAFIDDDEVPDAQWLERLLARMKETGCGICFGPVRPHYAVAPPAWAEKGPFFWKVGKVYGTSNMMLRASVLPADPAQWFQPSFAFLGGEDEEFLSRLASQGAGMAMAPDAWVTELVPQSRMTLAYIGNTGMRDGAIEVALMRQRNWPFFAKFTAATKHIAKKMGYIVYHLALMLAWQGSWHPIAAFRDAAEILGMIMALAGKTGVYYGKPNLSR